MDYASSTSQKSSFRIIDPSDKTNQQDRGTFVSDLSKHLGEPSAYAEVFFAQPGQDVPSEPGVKWVLKLARSQAYKPEFDNEFTLLRDLAARSQSDWETAYSPTPVYRVMSEDVTQKPGLVMPFYDRSLANELEQRWRDEQRIPNGLAFEQWLIQCLLQYTQLLLSLQAMGNVCTDRKTGDLFWHNNHLVVIDWNLVRDTGIGYETAQMNLLGRIWYALLTGYQPLPGVDPFDDRWWQRHGDANDTTGPISVGLRFLLNEALKGNISLDELYTALGEWVNTLEDTSNMKLPSRLKNTLTEGQRSLVKADLCWRVTQSEENLAERRRLLNRRTDDVQAAQEKLQPIKNAWLGGNRADTLNQLESSLITPAQRVLLRRWQILFGVQRVLEAYWDSKSNRGDSYDKRSQGRKQWFDWIETLEKPYENDNANDLEKIANDLSKIRETVLASDVDILIAEAKMRAALREADTHKPVSIEAQQKSSAWYDELTQEYREKLTVNRQSQTIHIKALREAVTWSAELASEYREGLLGDRNLSEELAAEQQAGETQAKIEAALETIRTEFDQALLEGNWADIDHRVRGIYQKQDSALAEFPDAQFGLKEAVAGIIRLAYSFSLLVTGTPLQVVQSLHYLQPNHLPQRNISPDVINSISSTLAEKINEVLSRADSVLNSGYPDNVSVVLNDCRILLNCRSEIPEVLRDKMDNLDRYQSIAEKQELFWRDLPEYARRGSVEVIKQARAAGVNIWENEELRVHADSVLGNIAKAEDTQRSLDQFRISLSQLRQTILGEEVKRPQRGPADATIVHPSTKAPNVPSPEIEGPPPSLKARIDQLQQDLQSLLSQNEQLTNALESQQKKSVSRRWAYGLAFFAAIALAVGIFGLVTALQNKNDRDGETTSQAGNGVEAIPTETVAPEATASETDIAMPVSTEEIAVATEALPIVTETEEVAVLPSVVTWQKPEAEIVIIPGDTTPHTLIFTLSNVPPDATFDVTVNPDGAITTTQPPTRNGESVEVSYLAGATETQATIMLHVKDASGQQEIATTEAFVQLAYEPLTVKITQNGQDIVNSEVWWPTGGNLSFDYMIKRQDFAPLLGSYSIELSMMEHITCVPSTPIQTDGTEKITVDCALVDPLFEGYDTIQISVLNSSNPPYRMPINIYQPATKITLDAAWTADGLLVEEDGNNRSVTVTLELPQSAQEAGHPVIVRYDVLLAPGEIATQDTILRVNGEDLTKQTDNPLILPALSADQAHPTLTLTAVTGIGLVKLTVSDGVPSSTAPRAEIIFPVAESVDGFARTQLDSNGTLDIDTWRSGYAIQVDNNRDVYFGFQYASGRYKPDYHLFVISNSGEAARYVLAPFIVFEKTNDSTKGNQVVIEQTNSPSLLPVTDFSTTLSGNIQSSVYIPAHIADNENDVNNGPNPYFVFALPTDQTGLSNGIYLQSPQNDVVSGYLTGTIPTTGLKSTAPATSTQTQPPASAPTGSTGNEAALEPNPNDSGAAEANITDGVATAQ